MVLYGKNTAEENIIRTLASFKDFLKLYEINLWNNSNECALFTLYISVHHSANILAYDITHSREFVKCASDVTDMTYVPTYMLCTLHISCFEHKNNS
jgi:hypothetical protein